MFQNSLATLGDVFFYQIDSLNNVIGISLLFATDNYNFLMELCFVCVSLFRQREGIGFYHSSILGRRHIL